MAVTNLKLSNPDLDAATVAILTLARFDIPADVQELLVRGDPARGIPPGALSAAFRAALEFYRSAEKS